MTKGFVTIATGQKRYFELARNLLRSYRLFSSENCSFAILCDEENEYTSEFDDVIILNHAYCNYLDKLQLYRYLPYDETIFIDADSLAYGDLDKWWSIFQNADDFSLFGYMWTNMDCGRGWFLPSGLKEYQNQVKYIPDFNGFTTPADEPVLALAMALQNCHPLDVLEGGLAFAPSKRKIDIDIFVPKAIYQRNNKQRYQVNLVHWSNYRTKLALYRFEVEKMNYLRDKSSISMLRFKLLYQFKFKYYLFCICNIRIYAERLSGKIRKILGK